MNHKESLRLAKKLMIIVLIINLISNLYLVYRNFSIGGILLETAILSLVGTFSTLLLNIVVLLLIIYFEKKEK